MLSSAMLTACKSAPSRAAITLLFAATSLSLTVTSGCRLGEWARNGYLVGPNYARPVAAVSESWIDANDPRVRSQVADYANWWRALNDPVLDSLVQEASSQNLTLRAAGFRILEAQARRRIAAGSLFPQQQQATFDYQRVNISRTIANSAPNPFFEDWDTGFDLAWELDLWGRFRRAVEEQDALLDASIENYDDLLVLMQADVAQTYVRLRNKACTS
jgi:outer membrane protein TolC